MRTRSTQHLVSLGAFVLFSLKLLISGSAHGAQPETPVPADSDDPARDAWVLPDEMGGIYEQQCAVCHGAKLEGAAQGPSLLGKLSHGASVPALVTSISKGNPSQGMPAWAGVLPDDDIRGLSIYILEQREDGTRDAQTGVGEPPVIPSEAFRSELHAFTTREIYRGLSEPYSIAPLPDGRILVTEKMRGISILAADGSSTTLVTGTPRIYDDSHLRGVTYTGQGWAHEVALHPEYAENGWIYFVYGDRCEGCNPRSRETGKPVSMLKLIRGRLAGSQWIDQETIWEAPKETYQDGMENGAGARIAFDDKGYVYLSLGAFTDYRGTQSLASPYGKIVRMHDDGRTPKDNPFASTPDALPGIYTLGHRNPQGLDFDPHTGQMWSSEHGPRGGDEGNLIRAGLNYGWPLVSLGVDYDGRPITYAKQYGIEFDPADLTPATIDFTPSPGVSSIVFYRGAAFPKWRNHLLVATLGGNDLLRLEVDKDGARHQEMLIEDLGRLRDVEVGPAGEILLLVEHRTGSIVLRIDPLRP